MTDTSAPPMMPEPQAITVDDVRAALSAGWADFRAAPAFGLFFGVVFSVVGIVIYAQLVVWGSSYWVLPIMAGFPLIGPFAAVGLYEVSRRREVGRDLDWAGILTVVRRERGSQIPAMAFVVLFFYLVWVYFAHLIFALSFGLTPLTNITSSPAILLGGPGLTMLVAGTIVGGGLAVILFSITVVAIPMLLDRRIDVVTAMIASVRTVLVNRGPMLVWAAIIAGLSVLAMIPMFLGMIVVFPVLGHATWHLYRRAVEPAEG